MKTCTLMLDDIKFKDKHPQEDSLLVKDNIFAIGDGITRDPIGISDFTGIKFEDALKLYPNPSPAKQAADTFTRSFIEFFNSNPDSIEISEAYKYSNQKIKELNAKGNPNPDYLENDYWACVACAGKIENNILYWGIIDDCCIKVLDRDLQVKLQTPNYHLNFEEYFHTQKNHPLDFDWNKPSGRKIVREQYRNKIVKNENGNLVSFGALTGEESAIEFLITGQLNLAEGDSVIFFSDGFEDFVNSNEFSTYISECKLSDSIDPIKNKSNELAQTDWRKFGRERSMILVTI